MQTRQLQYRIRQMFSDLERRAALHGVPVGPIECRPRGENAWQPFANGEEWGAAGEWYEFRFLCVVPEAHRGRVALRLRTGRDEERWTAGARFLCTVNGRVEQGLDAMHPFLVLADDAESGQVYSVHLDAYAPEQTKPILKAFLTSEDAQAMALLFDLCAPCEAAALLPEGDRDRERTLHLVSEALDLLDLRVPESDAWRESVAAARGFFRREYYEKRAALPPLVIAESVGHAPVDNAWLSDVEHARHMAAVSFATALKLMERYPEYRFLSSQSALLSFVKEDHPYLFERIQERVREGRWEAEGGMWAEADLRFVGGESLVRQFLHGQEFFRREFGAPSRVLRLSGASCYPAALPQIGRLCGVDYFLLDKPLQAGKSLFPYDLFLWKGLDGTEILAHRSPSEEGEQATCPEDSSSVGPERYASGWRQFGQKALDDRFLIRYGSCEGGPTEEMLEMSRRMAQPLSGVPVFRHTRAREYFEAVEKRVGNDPRLPKWAGELRWKRQCGFYTANAGYKRGNRRMERGLRDAELLSSMAYIEKGLPYPQEELHALWRETLELQSLGIPSRADALETPDPRYARMFALLEKARGRALNALAQDAPGDVVFCNTLGFERDDVVWFDAPEDVTALRDEAGEIWPVQRVPLLGGEGERCCAFVAGLKPMGLTPFWFERGDMDHCEWVDADRSGFDTPYFAGSFDESIRLSSLIEKQSGRELVRRGEVLNRLVVWNCPPGGSGCFEGDAFPDGRHWELDDLERCELISIGPVCAVLRCQYLYSLSRIVQDVYIYRDLERIDFDTWVDWQEDHALLAAHFPVDVFQSEVTCDAQFGVARRATTRNTEWDEGGWEVCAQKWADVSEDNFGFALLNDCKYGYRADEKGLALGLIHSASPDASADKGERRFLYSAMPHDGSWRDAGVSEMGYRLNAPVLSAAASGGREPLASFAASNRPNVVIETVKQQLAGDGIVLRVYEGWGRRETGARVRLGYAPAQAEIANLLEEPIAEADLDGNELVFNLRPYEIKTFLLS